jgi:hypothetical protein
MFLCSTLCSAGFFFSSPTVSFFPVSRERESERKAIVDLIGFPSFFSKAKERKRTKSDIAIKDDVTPPTTEAALKEGGTGVTHPRLNQRKEKSAKHEIISALDIKITVFHLKILTNQRHQLLLSK